MIAVAGFQVQVFADFVSVGRVAADIAVDAELALDDFADGQCLLRLVFGENFAVAESSSWTPTSSIGAAASMICSRAWIDARRTALPI